MSDVSTFRLYLLRAAYLLVAVGLAFTIWPQLALHETKWPLWYGVGCSLLAAVSVLAILGIRYPLQMLPVLLFELVWKIIWALAVGLPMWSADQMDAQTLGTAQDCLFGVVLLFVVPWRYVYANYVKKPGDRWK